MPEKIRVLIADDHTLVREGLRLLLNAQPDFRVVADAADGAAALRLALEYTPDVILMDIRMPHMDGICALEQIHTQCPQIKTLILTMLEDENVLFQVLRLGALGYVLKGASSAELIDALRVVSRGEIYLSPAMASLLVRDFVHGRRPQAGGDEASPAVLSAREREVLQRLAEGQTNAEIAARLVISASTVQTHRTRILEKLGLRTRSDLVKYALRHGLIQID